MSLEAYADRDVIGVGSLVQKVPNGVLAFFIISRSILSVNELLLVTQADIEVQRTRIPEARDRNEDTRHVAAYNGD